MNKKLAPAYLLTLVNVLGFSILMPILPFVVRDFGADKWVYGLLISLYSSFQFIGAPYLGRLSDSIGRKPVLLISQAGTLACWIVFLIALQLPEYMILGMSLPLWIIGVSRALDGITGGNTSVANAYVADITSREEKSYVFGYLGGIAGFGMIVGPAIGGFAASGSLGFAGTILVAILISITALILIYSWLQESLPEDKRRVREKANLWHTLNIPGRVRRVQPKPIIKLLFTLKLMFSTMMAFYISTIALYMVDTFHFNEQELAMFLFAVGIFLSFNQAVLSKQFIKRFGEFTTLIIGLSLLIVGFFAITLTDTLWVYIAFYYILNLGLSLCFPTFNALIAIHADPSKQGEIMGISESINSFAMAAFPVLGATLYSFMGYPMYYLVAILPLLAFLLAMIRRPKLQVN